MLVRIPILSIISSVVGLRLVVVLVVIVVLIVVVLVRVVVVLIIAIIRRLLVLRILPAIIACSLRIISVVLFPCTLFSGSLSRAS